jgi:hypothetical protein
VGGEAHHSLVGDLRFGPLRFYGYKPTDRTFIVCGCAMKSSRSIQSGRDSKAAFSETLRRVQIIESRLPSGSVLTTAQGLPRRYLSRTFRPLL